MFESVYQVDRTPSCGRSCNDFRTSLYRGISNRLQNEPGCQPVRYDPSRARPKRIVRAFDPDVFLRERYPISDARLEISFWFPGGANHEYYEIEWAEPDRNVGLGWHQDQTYQALGNCHFQIDYEGQTVCREGTAFVDRHRLNVLEARLGQLESLLPDLDWSDTTPSIPAGGLPTPS